MCGIKAISQLIGAGRFFRRTATHCFQPNTVEALQDNHNGIFGSLDAARLVFNELQNNPEFVWECIDEGCVARAHKMCNILAQKGYFSEKIRIENATSTWCCSYGLAVPREGAINQYLYLRFHIAVIVTVLEGNNLTDFVFDPSFFGYPVSVDNWSAKFINRESLDSNGIVNPAMQKKYYRRIAWDIFDDTLFFKIKDHNLTRTNAMLAMLRKQELIGPPKTGSPEKLV
jgi:hypothetical protein